MTTRPDTDAFAEAAQQAMRDSRRLVGGPVPVRDQLAEDMRAALTPVAEKLIADAVRPWRRATFWLAVGYGAFVVLSVVQALAIR